MTAELQNYERDRERVISVLNNLEVSPAILFATLSEILYALVAEHPDRERVRLELMRYLAREVEASRYDTH